MPTEQGSDSINKYRAAAWKDYFDLFLQHLELCLWQGEADSKLKTLMEKKNASKFFANMKIEDFRKTFYLEMYENWSLEHPLYLFHQNYTTKEMADEKLCTEYQAFCAKYIAASTDKIEKRSQTLVKKLKNIL